MSSQIDASADVETDADAVVGVAAVTCCLSAVTTETVVTLALLYATCLAAVSPRGGRLKARDTWRVCGDRRHHGSPSTHWLEVFMYNLVYHHFLHHTPGNDI